MQKNTVQVIVSCTKYEQERNFHRISKRLQMWHCFSIKKGNIKWKCYILNVTYILKTILSKLLYFTIKGQGQGFFICHIIVIQGITRSEMQSNQEMQLNHNGSNEIRNRTGVCLQATAVFR